MFLGENICRLDDKGRIIMPKRFLPAFVDGKVYFTLFKDSAWMYDEKVFNAIKQSVLGDGVYDNTKNFERVRAFCSNTCICKLDGALNRVTLPLSLREKLNSEALLVAAGNIIEVWNPEVYKEHIKDEQAKCLEIMKDELASVGNFTYSCKKN